MITVPNVKATPAKAELAFGKDFEANGSVFKITVATAKD
jgi:hypothetical protein